MMVSAARSCVCCRRRASYESSGQSRSTTDRLLATFWKGEFEARVLSTGAMNAAIPSTTQRSSLGAVSRRFFLRKAVHGVFFSRESANSEVRTSGIPCGIGVRR